MSICPYSANIAHKSMEGYIMKTILVLLSGGGKGEFFSSGVAIITIVLFKCFIFMREKEKIPFSISLPT